MSNPDPLETLTFMWFLTRTTSDPASPAYHQELAEHIVTYYNTHTAHTNAPAPGTNIDPNPTETIDRFLTRHHRNNIAFTLHVAEHYRNLPAPLLNLLYPRHLTALQSAALLMNNRNTTPEMIGHHYTEFFWWWTPWDKGHCLGLYFTHPASPEWVKTSLANSPDLDTAISLAANRWLLPLAVQETVAHNFFPEMFPSHTPHPIRVARTEEFRIARQNTRQMAELQRHLSTAGVLPPARVFSTATTKLSSSSPVKNPMRHFNI